MVKKSLKKEKKKLQIQLAKKTAAKAPKKPVAKQDGSHAHIKNKQKRSQLVDLDQRAKRTERAKGRRARREAEERGEEVTREKPFTVEEMRDFDETIVPADDEEVDFDTANDEFAEYFAAGQRAAAAGEEGPMPKIMVTTSLAKPSSKLYDVLKELLIVIPNTTFYKRKDLPLKKIVEYATNRDFTALIVLEEDKRKKEPRGLYVIHLPRGPTAYFRITNVKKAVDIKGGATCNAEHAPELILNNFTTRLGRRLERVFAALFPVRPDFQGRRVICFHSQRDFIFFRHYRYEFKANGEKCGLKEIGPSFTLKLRYLQKGSFDGREGEYEFLWRPDSQVSRKKFFL